MYSSDIFRYEPYFGSSPAMQQVKERIKIAATKRCAVLLLGETGSGKSVIARRIHELSPRRKRKFVDIDCSGLRGGLLKTELFGHCKGAFTGAVNNRPGLIEEANGGTLFLDEIGDMDISVQCQLLKSIEEQTYRRVGENRYRSSDFRLICATNRNLEEAVTTGAFRKDLYYRINTLSINIPSLKERKEDIAGLSGHILNILGYNRPPLNETVLYALARYSWPGNVRELRNILERALVFAQSETLAIEHFPEIAGAAPPESPASSQTGAEQAGLMKEIIWDLDEAENNQIMRALRHFNGNKARASKALGISLSSLYRKLDQILDGTAVGAVIPAHSG